MRPSVSARVRRTGLAAIGCAALGLIGPAAAHADGQVVFTDFGDGTSLLSFASAAADVNDVVVSGTDAQVTITNTVPMTVSVGSSPGCTGSGTVTVVCAGAGIAFNATLGDQADRVVVTAVLTTTLGGGAGGDQILGGPGNDTIFGGPGPDDIEGRAGDDFVNTGTGDLADDVVDGGPGADDLGLEDFDGADRLDGGAGIDTVNTIGGGFLQPGYRYTLGDGLANDGLGQGANLLNIEDIVAGETSDFIRGTDGPNFITTIDGFDDVDGLGGADFIALGSQDDTVEARDGFSDRILCSSGIDTATVDQLDVLSDCENVTRVFVEPAGTPHAAAASAELVTAPETVATAAPDTSAPVCTTAAPRAISDPRRAIVLRASCDEPVSLRVTLSGRPSARVVAAGVGDVTLVERSLTLRRATRSLRLPIPRRLHATLGRRATLRLRVELTDAAGNRVVQNRTIRLRQS